MGNHQRESAPQRADLAARLNWKIVVPVLAVLLLAAVLAIASSQQLLARGTGTDVVGTSTTSNQSGQATPATTPPAPEPSPTKNADPSESSASPSTPSKKSASTSGAAGSSTQAETSQHQDRPPPTAAPQRISVPAAGIDVAVLPLTPTSGDLASQSIVPPFTEDGYWLTSYGKPGAGSQNTTYITGHSWSDREAPFDRLSTHTEVGDRITVTTGTGKLTYIVDSITTHNKDTLRTSDIWNIVPNRLVLISCYTEDPWGKNVVVTATPAQPASVAAEG